MEGAGRFGAKRLRVRATGILVEEGRVLLVRQTLRERSRWNLPGGSLEVGETLAACLVREMREETGLMVVPADLLYVCDRRELSGAARKRAVVCAGAFRRRALA